MSKKQKIILISPAHPLRGGIAASSERLAEAMIDAGHEVEIWSFSLQYPAFLFPGKSQKTTDPAPKNLKIRTVLNSINPLNWIFWGFKLGRSDADLAVARFWMPFFGPCLGTLFFVARLVSKAFSKKTKTTFSALIDNIVPHEKRFGDRLFSSFFAKSCDRFAVMSRAVGEELRAFADGKKIGFAPHPIYDNYGERISTHHAKEILQLPHSERVVLFFGFIRDYKGLDLLIAAMGDERLLESKIGQKIRLVVAGECYENWSRYEDLIEKAGLKNRVSLDLDFIPSEKIAAYFSAADIVAQPYKTATQSGISQIAYHFETPMLVTRVGGLPEIVADQIAGYVVEPNPKAIADALVDFFENDRKAEFSAGVRSEKARFSWQNLIDAILNDK